MGKLIWVVYRIVKHGYKEKASLIYLCKTKELADYAASKLNEKYKQTIENCNNSGEIYMSFYVSSYRPLCITKKFIDETMDFTNAF